MAGEKERFCNRGPLWKTGAVLCTVVLLFIHYPRPHTRSHQEGVCCPSVSMGARGIFDRISWSTPSACTFAALRPLCLSLEFCVGYPERLQLISDPLKVFHLTLQVSVRYPECQQTHRGPLEGPSPVPARPPVRVVIPAGLCEHPPGSCAIPARPFEHPPSLFVIFPGPPGSDRHPGYLLRPRSICSGTYPPGSCRVFLRHLPGSSLHEHLQGP